MKIQLLLFLFIIPLFIFSENELSINTTSKKNNLNEYAYYLTDSTNNFSVNNVDTAIWEKLNKPPTIRPSNNSTWFKYTISNTSNKQIEQYIFIPYFYVHNVDVYLKENNNIVRIAKTGIKRIKNLSKNKTLGYSIPVSLKSNSTTTVYIRFNSPYRPYRASTYLISKNEYENISFYNSGVLWFWKGIYTFALLTSLVVFFFLKNKMFLYYFFLNVGISLFISSQIGDYLRLFGVDSTDITVSVGSTGSLLINMFLPLFLNSLTPLKKNNKKLWKFMSILIYIMIPVIIINYFPSLRQGVFTLIVHNYTMIATAVILLILIYMLIKNVINRQKNAIALFFVYLIYVFSGVHDIIAPNMGLVSDSAYLFRFVIIGSLIEVFSYLVLMAKDSLHVYNERTKLIEIQKNHQREIIYTMVNSQEEERNRTGRELHDLIGGNMAIIKKKINTYDEELKSIVNNTVEAVRTLSHGLVSPMVDDNQFIEEIKQMAHIASNNEMKIHVNFHDWPKIKDTTRTTHIYRICQELVQNANKHSKASNVYFQFIGTDNSINIYYEDDGVGFNNNNTDKGLGLRNIGSRVELLKGILNIDSNSSGTIISIEI